MGLEFFHLYTFQAGNQATGSVFMLVINSFVVGCLLQESTEAYLQFQSNGVTIHTESFAFICPGLVLNDNFLSLGTLGDEGTLFDHWFVMTILEELKKTMQINMMTHVRTDIHMCMHTNVHTYVHR